MNSECVVVIFECSRWQIRIIHSRVKTQLVDFVRTIISMSRYSQRIFWFARVEAGPGGGLIALYSHCPGLARPHKGQTPTGLIK